jgi:hypothetical protein
VDVCLARRYAWEHSIAFRKTDRMLVDGRWAARPRARRLSLTFRRIAEQVGSTRVQATPFARSCHRTLMAVGQPCRCPYPQLCDSQEGQLKPTYKAEQLQQRVANGEEVKKKAEASTDARAELAQRPAAEVEKEHVVAFYDAIAEHFDHTRQVVRCA